MIKITVTKSLLKEIKKKFGKEQSMLILDLFKTLKENPRKGKKVGSIGKIVIKELKYKKFRFYFLFENHELKLLLKGEIYELLFKFIKMSKKNNQQSVIDDIKKLLKELDFDDVI